MAHGICYVAFAQEAFLDGLVRSALLRYLAVAHYGRGRGDWAESEYPAHWPPEVERMVAADAKGKDLSAAQLQATTAPMFFIHGDADGIRLEHVAEMFRLKGGEIHGDMKPRSASRLAILPDTTHVTLMQRMPIIVPMLNDFLDAKP